MIELNLLPDLKLEYIKTQRTQKLVISVSLLVTAAAVVLLVILLAADGLQRKHLSDLASNITKESKTLKGEPNINKILTVQNQAESLGALHDAKPEASKLFTYLNQVTPNNVSISNIDIDFTQYTATITGTADTLISVNTYVDTLKNATYTSKSMTSATPAFSNIVLSSFGYSFNKTDPSSSASYSITLAYDQNIFKITEDAKLSVPTKTTTHAGETNPNDLFKAAPDSSASNTSSGGTQ